ncbi:unnamed protein product [Caenorhabditis bovis]|uniref:Uncharacterized protein n=1 Tax=Caenorhabditis bovis TaxID=2654633 RepID=A0A8S1FBH6_9PELO|nr:unnamed protein product [Caenorhabditis bovis]
MLFISGQGHINRPEIPVYYGQRDIWVAILQCFVGFSFILLTLAIMLIHEAITSPAAKKNAKTSRFKQKECVEWHMREEIYNGLDNYRRERRWLMKQSSSSSMDSTTRKPQGIFPSKETKKTLWCITDEILNMFQCELSKQNIMVAATTAWTRFRRGLPIYAWPILAGAIIFVDWNHTREWKAAGRVSALQKEIIGTQ